MLPTRAGPQEQEGTVGVFPMLLDVLTVTQTDGQHQLAAFSNSGALPGDSKRQRVEQTKPERDPIQRLSSDIEFMADTSLGRRYPPGTKPFISQVSALEHDEFWSACTAGPFVVSITVPQGCSRRQAMEVIHRSAATAQKPILLQCANVLVQNLEPLVARSSFLEAVANSKNRNGDHRGFDPGRVLSPSAALAMEKLEAVLAAIIARAKRNAGKAKQEVEDKLQQKRVEEKALLNNKSDSLLEEWFDKRVVQKSMMFLFLFSLGVQTRVGRKFRLFAQMWPKSVRR